MCYHLSLSLSHNLFLSLSLAISLFLFSFSLFRSLSLSRDHFSSPVFLSPSLSLSLLTTEIAFLPRRPQGEIPLLYLSISRDRNKFLRKERSKERHMTSLCLFLSFPLYCPHYFRATSLPSLCKCMCIHVHVRERKFSPPSSSLLACTCACIGGEEDILAPLFLIA